MWSGTGFNLHCRPWRLGNVRRITHDHLRPFYVEPPKRRGRPEIRLGESCSIRESEAHSVLLGDALCVTVDVQSQQCCIAVAAEEVEANEPAPRSQLRYAEAGVSAADGSRRPSH